VASRAGAGFDQLFDRRHYHQQQVCLTRLRLLDHSELLCLPGIRRALALVEIVECLKSRRTQPRQILRQRNIFLEEERLLEQRMQPGVVVTPGGEITANLGFGGSVF
jgi:hypothetical protein